MKLVTLKEQLLEHFNEKLVDVSTALNELTITINVSDVLTVFTALRDTFQFDMLIDVTAVDYLAYGIAEWETEDATNNGFDRAVNRINLADIELDTKRYAVVYHLLSIKMNQRLRIKVYIDGEPPKIDSVVDLWPSANWFEREVFDMFGIIFDGHPDLRRILTDYGFVGHPFRKDFPLSGHVEVRYDATQGRVIYEPVDIEPRVLVPKVIRQDNRYQKTEVESNNE